MPKVLPENIKNDILSTTRRLVVEQGYNKISIRDITRESGIATGTFYNYYNSKQEVLSSLLYDDWDRLQNLLKSRSKSSELTVIQQLEECFTGLQAMMISVHELWALGFPDELAADSMNRMAQVKKQLSEDYAQTIQGIIHGHTDPDKEEFLAGFIGRMFFTYAYDRTVSFNDLRYIIDKLVD
jgi:AcrR family transcriptional regulator